MPRLATLRSLASASKAARQPSSCRGDGKSGEKLLEGVLRPVVTAPLQMAGPASQASQLQVVAAGGNPAEIMKQVRGDVGADALRTRLFSFREEERAQYMSSSGSEHEPSSACLAAMVHEFMQEDGNTKVATKCGRPRCNCENGVCDGLAAATDNDDTKSVHGRELAEIVQGLVPCVGPLERSLLLDATQAVAKVKEDANLICKDVGESCTNCLRRLVMGELRRRGYNAAICKSRWDHAGGYPGGDYEYIDVLVDDGKEERLVVDIEFRAQFEIARPTSSYQGLLNSLPAIFAGRADRIHQLVKIMSDGARRSLKKRGLYLPPWRKPEYLRAKWLSAYRRTTNPIPPQHLVVDSQLNREVGSLAVRGHGWDERFRTAMEFHYQRQEGGDQEALKEKMENDLAVGSVRKLAGSSALTAQLKAAAKSEVVPDGARGSRHNMVAAAAAAAKEAELEGRVRGANKMLFTRASNDPMVSGLGTGLQIRDNSDWKLPAVEPRSPHRTKMVTGLASMLGKARVQQQVEQNSSTRALVVVAV